MRAIFVFVFLCLFAIQTKSAPQDLNKEYVIKILSNIEIKSIDIRGEPLKSPDAPANGTATAGPSNQPSGASLVTTLAPTNKTTTEEPEEEEK